MDANSIKPEPDPNAPLSARQERFVQEYLIDLCSARAAFRAGYSKATARITGCKLLTKANIRRAIDQAKAERAKRLGISADRVVQEMLMLAFSDIRDIEINADGRIDTIFPEAARAVASVTIDRTETKIGPRVKSTIRMHNKLQALVILMQHLGLTMPELPPLENLLNRLPPEVSAMLRMMMANPNLRPKTGVPVEPG